MSFVSQVKSLVEEAEAHSNSMAKDRIRAIEYYDGKMIDTPADEGRSQMVTRDLRAQIKKVLPSLVRTLLGNEKVVEFQPVAEGDEQGADQASDYINHVLMTEAKVWVAIYDGCFDALLQRNGILKWWYDQRIRSKSSTHTGLPDDAFAELVNDESVTVLEHTERAEVLDTGESITVHDCKIKRVSKSGMFCTAAVPRERFLIHPDAITLDDSPIVGEKTTLTRSDLVAMGYDRAMVDALPISDEDDIESQTRRDTTYSGKSAEEGAIVPIDYYDLYVRIDADDDGIAELHHMCFAGGLGENNLLLDEECDDVQFCDVAVMRKPHQWEGVSLADDIMDLQRAKTVLFRETIDNIYWQNRLQPWVQDGAIVNPDAVYNPEFGLPIRVKAGIDVRTALGYNQVPFVAANSFPMMEYMDKEAQDRTGVSDASAGLAPDALQNMTAKASAMIEAQGIGQTELMVKTLAEGLKVFFRGILRLAIRHQDVPRTVRLRNEWVSFDPRQWNAEMDCTVNTGLGAGTRERDMVVMQQVMMAQEKLLMAFGPDNPFVKPDQVYNATAKLIEAAGLKGIGAYFTKPDLQEVQAKLDDAKKAPSPEQMKMQAQSQIEQAKMQATMQVEQMKMQMAMELEKAKMAVSTQKETAQMQADLQVKAAERATQLAVVDRELALKREELQAKQRMEMVKLGLVQNEQGEPVNEANQGMMQAIQALSMVMAQAAKPKRIVRDANGDAIGVETYDPMVN